MQKDVTEKLKQEHQLILKYIEIFGLYLQRISQQPESSLLLEKLPLFIDFIQNYSDRYHHAKEENILFKISERPHVLTHCNPIPQMLYEHDNGREFVKEILAALAEKNVTSLIANGNSWRQLLIEHIFKEDNILYPMTEEGLLEEDRVLIHQEYEKTEKEFKGVAFEERYQQMYLELKQFLAQC